MRMTYFRCILIVLLAYVVYKRRFRILHLLIGVAGLRQLIWSQSNELRRFLYRGMDRVKDRDLQDNE